MTVVKRKSWHKHVYMDTRTYNPMDRSTVGNHDPNFNRQAITLPKATNYPTPGFKVTVENQLPTTRPKRQDISFSIATRVHVCNIKTSDITA